MKRTLSLVFGALATLGGFTLQATELSAQKAAIYCAEATGCGNVANALSGSFPGGVDRVFNGTNSTLDIRTVDMSQYAVFFVPSLADNGSRQPYALLRDATVAAKLSAALTGRAAVWSGTPDQGKANRDAKDQLIRNLAQYAAAEYATTKAPGLVVLQDASATMTARYNWLQAISGRSISADPTAKVFGRASGLTEVGKQVLGSLAYGNMASFGLTLPGDQDWVAGAAGAENAIAFNGLTSTGALGMSGAGLVSTVKAMWASMFSTANTVLATSGGKNGGYLKGGTISVVYKENTGTLTAGQISSAQYTVTVTPPAGISGPHSATLSAARLPTWLQASWSTPTLDFSGTSPQGSQTATLTLTTTTAATAGTTGKSPEFEIRGDSNGDNTHVLWTGTVNIATCTAPSIATQPSPQSITYGVNTSFTAAGGGSPTPSVKWQVSTNSGSSWSDVSDGGVYSGATTTTLTVTKPGVALSGSQYRAVFTNECGGTQTATSNAAALAVAAKSVNGSFTVAASKEYDGTTAAAITGRALQGAITGDDVSLSGGSAAYADKAVGTNKAVTGSGFTLAGAAKDNYTLGTVSNTTAAITAKSITGSFTADNKQYDGNTSATVLTRTLSGAVSGDAVSLNGGTATFADKNIGTGKTVTLTGASLSGTDAGNYNITSVGTTTANITAITVTGSFTAANKVYDGNATATISGRSITGGVVGSETVTLTGGSATFDTKNVGTNKTVTGTIFELGGADAGNYTLGTVATATANITAKEVTVSSFTAANKVYDGNTVAAITGTPALSGVVGSDAVSVSGATATFDTKNVGTGKTVMLADASLAGTDAGNYSLSATTVTSKANITAKAITGGFTADNKQYDGNTSATVLTRTLSGAVSGDAVILNGGTATFDTKDVGTDKTVTLAGANLSGTDMGNYTLGSVGTTTADITQKELTGSFSAANKVYDGNTVAAITGTPALTGVVGTDAVSLTLAGATFDNKNVGTGKTVTATTPSLSGAAAGNYSLTSVATTTANITTKALAVSATGVNKVFDRTTAATVTLSDDRVAGDVLSTSYVSAAFADANVGTAKPVTVSGMAISGTDAGNYTANTSTTTTADITPANATIAFVETGMVKPVTASLLQPDVTTSPTGLKVTFQYYLNGQLLTSAPTTPGVYEVVATSGDTNYTAVAAKGLFVIYDPNGGFVTGGGWIQSQQSFCKETASCANAAGKATFGFVSKYKQGQSTPSGNTEFQLQAGGFNLKSTSYEWLVVNQGGINAQFKGTATINGTGTFKFQIWATDSNPDKFRIRVWREVNGSEVTVYDNETDVALGGGSIQIKEK